MLVHLPPGLYCLNNKYNHYIIQFNFWGENKLTGGKKNKLCY